MVQINIGQFFMSNWPWESFGKNPEKSGNKKDTFWGNIWENKCGILLSFKAGFRNDSRFKSALVPVSKNPPLRDGQQTNVVCCSFFVHFLNHLVSGGFYKLNRKYGLAEMGGKIPSAGKERQLMPKMSKKIRRLWEFSSIPKQEGGSTTANAVVAGKPANRATVPKLCSVQGMLQNPRPKPLGAGKRCTDTSAFPRSEAAGRSEKIHKNDTITAHRM